MADRSCRVFLSEDGGAALLQQIFCGRDLHAGEKLAMLCTDETLSLNSFSYSYTRGNRPPDSGARTRRFACGPLAKDNAGAGFPLFMASRDVGQEAEARDQPRHERENQTGQQSDDDGAILDQAHPEPLPDGRAAGRPGGRTTGCCLPCPARIGGASIRVRHSLTARTGHRARLPSPLSLLRSRRLGRPRTGPDGVRPPGFGRAIHVRPVVARRGRLPGLGLWWGRGSAGAALSLSQGQSAHVSFSQQAVGSFPERLQQTPLQQGLDLLLTGVQRLGCFLQRTEHVAHFHLLRGASVRACLTASSAIWFFDCRACESRAAAGPQSRSRRQCTGRLE